VDFWRGENIVRDDEAQGTFLHRDDDFLLPSIKEVVRVAPEERPSSKRKGRATSKAPGRPKSRSKQHQLQMADLDNEEEPEAWELNPGTVTGEVVLWEPEHEMHPPADDEPVQITEDQIAISADAVRTTDIRDATFRFAKTLTMPFMNAGVVDLPPGSEKRPKNSRKMHMVFFVHYGKVLVTVNEAQFRISAGGMWFVPRGKLCSTTQPNFAPLNII
jgi:centromere protein C